jgi:hypothetical protein
MKTVRDSFTKNVLIMGIFLVFMLLVYLFAGNQPIKNIAVGASCFALIDFSRIINKDNLPQVNDFVRNFLNICIVATTFIIIKMFLVI